MENNASLLMKLREKPLVSGHWQDRLTQIDGLLDQNTLHQILQTLRWPKGIRCPRCHSSRIRLLEMPRYLCEACEQQGFQAEFSIITNLPDNWLYHLRQLLLCWFLQPICSVTQLAQKFNLNPQLIKQFMQWYEQQKELENELEKSEQQETQSPALQKQESIDGIQTKQKAGRFIVERSGFEWDAEEARILKARRHKLRD